MCHLLYLLLMWSICGYLMISFFFAMCITVINTVEGTEDDQINPLFSIFWPYIICNL